MKNVSKLQAIAGAKCPQCRSGNIFRHRSTQINHFTDTYERCPVCGLQYEVEPGFFIAAMYISYALSVGWAFVAGALVYMLGKDPDLWVYLTVVTVSLLLFVPPFFRYSRVLLLYFFSGVKYNPSLSR